MKFVGTRWHCMPCNANNAELEAERKSGPRYGIGLGLGFREIPMWVRVVLGVLTASLWMIPQGLRFYARSHTLFVTAEPAEPWSVKPTAQWPQLTLVNDVELKGIPKTTGGAGFLIQTKDGSILGATHSLREALGDKGDEPSMNNGELNQHFVSWRMFPAGTPDRAITFNGFYGMPVRHSDGDVWLLQASVGKNLPPVTPLKVRRTPLVRGTRLYVVARPSDDPSGKEQAFPCKVYTVAFQGEVLGLVYDKPVVSIGFAGAPLVDAQGHLAGIVTGPAEDPRADGSVMWLEAMGAAGVRELVE